MRELAIRLVSDDKKYLLGYGTIEVSGQLSILDTELLKSQVNFRQAHNESCCGL